MGQCASMACCWMSTREAVVSSKTTRFFYFSLFLVFELLALMLRDHSINSPFFLKYKWLFNAQNLVCAESNPCKGRIMVYRMCLVLAVFHALMAFCTVGNSARKLQNGFWIGKIAVIVLGVVGALFVPVKNLMEFASACKFFAGVFLVIQIILLIDFSYEWNENWVAKDWLKGILFAALLLFALSLTFVVLGFLWFAKGHGCGLFQFLVSSGLVLSIVVTIMAIFTERGAILPAMIICSQITMGIFSGLQASRNSCNSMLADAKSQVITMVAGMVFTMASLAYAAMRAGSSNDVFSLERRELSALGDGDLLGAPSSGSSADGAKDDQYYNYTFFHIIFFCASCYLAMLLTGWGADEEIAMYSIREGEIGLWVRVVAAWVTGFMYLWSLVAPYVLKNRSFD